MVGNIFRLVFSRPLEKYNVGGLEDPFTNFSTNLTHFLDDICTVAGGRSTESSLKSTPGHLRLNWAHFGTFFNRFPANVPEKKAQKRS